MEEIELQNQPPVEPAVETASEATPAARPRPFKLLPILAGVAALFLVAAGAYQLGKQQGLSVRLPNQDNQVACTLEAMICPDGSAVGRVPPSCEFAPCPNLTSP